MPIIAHYDKRKREATSLQNDMDLLKGSVRYLDVPMHNSILVKVFKT
jgi:hypothetical protein